MRPVSIVVDIWSMRCGGCKVALHDELATECPVCGAPFDSVSSNHAGLAVKLEQRREAAGVKPCGLSVADPEYDPSELVSC